MPVSSYGGPHVLVPSPLPGRSIFVTAAPRSASTIVARGPASTREKSTIRRSANALAIHVYIRSSKIHRQRSGPVCRALQLPPRRSAPRTSRSEEHTSELQSLRHLVCRL